MQIYILFKKCKYIFFPWNCVNYSMHNQTQLWFPVILFSGITFLWILYSQASIKPSTKRPFKIFNDIIKKKNKVKIPQIYFSIKIQIFSHQANLNFLQILFNWLWRVFPSWNRKLDHLRRNPNFLLGSLLFFSSKFDYTKSTFIVQ